MAIYNNDVSLAGVSKSVRATLVLFAIALCVGYFTWRPSLSSSSTLPAYWSTVSPSWPGQPNAARDDIRRLGADAVPGLLREVSRRHLIESPLIQGLRRKLPQKLAAMIPDPGTVAWRRHAAIWLLGELGPSASNAIPELERRRDVSSDVTERARALIALARIQPQNPAARSNMSQMLSSQQQTERYFAALEFGSLTCTSPSELTPLISALTDSDGEVRANAAYSVAQFGPLASAAIPTLRTLLNDSYRHVPTCAAFALLSMGPEHAPEAVATLTNHLNRTSDLSLMVARPFFRRGGTSAALAVPYLIQTAAASQFSWADLALCQVSPVPPQEAIDRLARHVGTDLDEIETLGDLGGAASNAVPRLRELQQGSDSPSIREAASEALSRITHGAPIRRH